MLTLPGVPLQPPEQPGLGVGGHWLKCASHGPSAVVAPRQRVLCSKNEVFACPYSQVYKALPQFNYPPSIQDEPFCDFYWWDSKMETYKLFQVNNLSLLVSPHPGASPKCWESHTCGKGLSCQAQAPSPLVFCSPGTTHCWKGDIPPAGCGSWTTSAFS